MKYFSHLKKPKKSFLNFKGKDKDQDKDKDKDWELGHFDPEYFTQD